MAAPLEPLRRHAPADARRGRRLSRELLALLAVYRQHVPGEPGPEGCRLDPSQFQILPVPDPAAIGKESSGGAVMGAPQRSRHPARDQRAGLHRHPGDGHRRALVRAGHHRLGRPDRPGRRVRAGPVRRRQGARRPSRRPARPAAGECGRRPRQRRGDRRDPGATTTVRSSCPCCSRWSPSPAPARSGRHGQAHGGAVPGGRRRSAAGTADRAVRRHRARRGTDRAAAGRGA